MRYLTDMLHEGEGQGEETAETTHTPDTAAHAEVVDGVIDGILLNTQIAGGEAVSIWCCDDVLNYYLHRQQNLTLSDPYVTHIGCSFGDYHSPPLPSLLITISCDCHMTMPMPHPLTCSPSMFCSFLLSSNNTRDRAEMIGGVAVQVVRANVRAVG